MIYNKIFSYVNPETFVMRRTIQEITSMDKNEFYDIIRLYLRMSSILKGEGYKNINSNDPLTGEDGNYIVNDFDSNAFNYLFLEKGSSINMNRLVAMSTFVKGFIMIEDYLQSVLIRVNPQLDIFREFIDDDFENIKYVFNKDIYDTTIYISYTDEKGELIEIKDKKDVFDYNKVQMDHIYNNCKLPNRVYILIGHIRDMHFSKYKKILLNAMELNTKGVNLLEDGLFMRTLEVSYKDLLDKKNKRDGEKKLKDSENKKIIETKKADKIELEKSIGVKI